MSSEADGADPRIAFVFPGQGAQTLDMLEPFREVPSFTTHYDRVCSLLGCDPLAEARRDPQVLWRNAESSLLTVLASVLALELHNARKPCSVPRAVAGYSVGQWTALYAAGAIGADDLFPIVFARARLMEQCLDPAAPSGLLAVVGVAPSAIASVCEQVAAHGSWLVVTNDNAPAHMTVGGPDAALLRGEELLRQLRPKRLQRVPAAGAWHSPQLIPAAGELRTRLERVALHTPRLPVIDNTTGEWLPDNPDECRDALAHHVASPVQWRRGINRLIADGCTTFVEIGYGDMLSKFGFFIDRRQHHWAIAPPRRA